MLPNPHLLIGPFVRREAVLSSRIEGTIANEEDLVLFKVDPEVQDRKPDTLEVRNYVTALEYGLKRLRELPVSLKLFGELHGRLLKGVRGTDKSPGEFAIGRTILAHLAQRSLMPGLCHTPVPEMKQALAAFENFLHGPSERPFLIGLGAVALSI